MNNFLKTSITYKEILRISAPISLAILIPQINYFTNTVFLGRLGERELGVNGITGVFYLILSMIGYGLANGIQVQLSRRAGEQNKEGLAEIFSNGILLALLGSLGLMLFCMWLVPLLFSYSLHDYENFSLSINYMYIRVWGLPFLMLSQLFSAFYISIGRTKLLIYGSLVTTIINILFDYIFIFGKFGCPLLGFEGAAVASVIAEIFYFITMTGIFLFLNLHKEYPVFHFLDFDFHLSKKSLNIAAPLTLQFIFSIGGWLVFFIFVEHLGKQSLAASQLLRNIFGIVGVGTWALATTCNTLVSQLIGKGIQKEVYGLIFKITKLSLGFTAILCILLLLFSPNFLSIYTKDSSLILFSIPSLRIIVVATLIMAVSTIFFNAVVGTGNTVINLTIEILCIILYLTYCYFVIYLWKSPLYWCWGAEFVYWISLLVFSFFYLRSGKWKGKKI